MSEFDSMASFVRESLSSKLKEGSRIWQVITVLAQVAASILITPFSVHIILSLSESLTT